jgi:single-strand DNA-binding protein
MRSVNKVILIGHLAADPEQSTTTSGRSRVTFLLATRRDAASEGTKRDTTDYHRIVAWGKLGEICGRYLAKGQGVYIDGVIIYRAYEKDGRRRYITEIVADEVNMLTWKERQGDPKVMLEGPETP